MTILNANTLSLKQEFSLIGGFVFLSLMMYGVLTSFLLQFIFYQKLSHFFMKKKESAECEENL